MAPFARTGLCESEFKRLCPALSGNSAHSLLQPLFASIRLNEVPLPRFWRGRVRGVLKPRREGVGPGGARSPGRVSPPPPRTTMATTSTRSADAWALVPELLERASSSSSNTSSSVFDSRRYVAVKAYHSNKRSTSVVCRRLGVLATALHVAVLIAMLLMLARMWFPAGGTIASAPTPAPIRSLVASSSSTTSFACRPEVRYLQVYHLSKCGGSNFRRVLRAALNVTDVADAAGEDVNRAWWFEDHGVLRREREYLPDPRYGRDPNSPAKREAFIIGFIRNPFGYYRSFYSMLLRCVDACVRAIPPSASHADPTLPFLPCFACTHARIKKRLRQLPPRSERVRRRGRAVDRRGVGLPVHCGGAARQVAFARSRERAPPSQQHGGVPRVRRREPRERAHAHTLPSFAFADTHHPVPLLSLPFSFLSFSFLSFPFLSFPFLFPADTSIWPSASPRPS